MNAISPAAAGARDLPPHERRFLEAVEARLARALGVGLDGCNGLARTVTQTILAPGAKRLRPRLVLGLGGLAGNFEPTLVALAAAAELIHSASLLHDDVVDTAGERRGRPTANRLHGNPRAVLGGDLVLSLAFVEVQHLAPAVTEAAVRVVAEMSRAALLEVDVRGDADLVASLGDPAAARAATDTWTAIAEGKTGALFGWCGAAPALAAYWPPLAARLDAFGRRFGVAFQLADDIFDVASGDDLLDRQPTLPLLLACERSADLRERAVDLWRAPHRDAARALGAAIASSGALEVAADRVAALLDEAAGALGDLAGAAAPVVAWTRLLRQSVGR